MSDITKTIYWIDRKEVIESLEAVMWSDFETIDKSIKYLGKEVIAWYALGIITEEQKHKLAEYRTRKENQKNEERDERNIDKLKLLEQFSEDPEIYQHWLIQWRIVVASVRIESDWKKPIKKLNWKMIVLWKDKTPKAYKYAQDNYQLHQEF
jgi:hypothetical protein